MALYLPSPPFASIPSVSVSPASWDIDVSVPLGTSASSTPRGAAGIPWETDAYLPSGGPVPATRRETIATTTANKTAATNINHTVPATVPINLRFVIATSEPI